MRAFGKEDSYERNPEGVSQGGLPQSGKSFFLLCKSIAKQQDAPFSRPFGATEKDAQKLHALWLLPMIVVRNTAHEVLCPCAKTVETEEAPRRGRRTDGQKGKMSPRKKAAFAKQRAKKK